MSDPQQQSLRTLYRRSRIEQPSELLDKRVRKAASRAIYQKRTRWLWGLSTAAVLVLSVNIVFQLLDTGDDFAPTLMQDSEPSSPMVSKEREELAQRKISSAPRTLAQQQDVGEQLKHEAVASSLAKKSVQSDVASQSLQSDNMQANEVFSETPGVASMTLTKEAVSLQTVIPELPFQLSELLLLDRSLSGEQDSNGDISLYQGSRLVLRLTVSEGPAVFKAWEGSESLGVRVDWSLSPAQLPICNPVDGVLACRLSERSEALFIDNRLDHISWRPENE